MTKQEKYTLAKWAMQYALDNGAQDASVVIANSSGSSIEYRDQMVDKLEQSIEKGLTIRLYVDQRYTTASTNRLNKEGLKSFIKQAIEGAQYLSEDEYRKLPNPDLYYTGGGKDLETFDAKFESVEPEEKVALLQSLEKEVLGTDERIISVSTTYGDGQSEKVMVTSNGFEGDSRSTYCVLGASVSVKSGDARPSGGWYDSSISFDELKKTGLAKIALDKAIEKIGQQKIESENMPMLVENESVSRMLGPIISALNGASIQQKNSFLLDKIGKKVFSSKLSLIDDPTITKGRASRHFDREGMLAKKRNIVKEGVLETYFINTYYANKMDIEPTTAGTSNIIFENGAGSLNDMISGIKRGMFVTGFNGGNCNPTSGDFSYGIEGFLIEDGKKTTPINEMNITGNMLDLWNNVEKIADDAEDSDAWQTPSILFNNVSFSGM